MTYAPHPGPILTNMTYLFKGFIGSIINTIVSMVSKTPEQGAINILYPVFSAENKESGKYYNQGIEQKPNKLVDDSELIKNLWNISEKILKDHGII